MAGKWRTVDTFSMHVPINVPIWQFAGENKKVRIMCQSQSAYASLATKSRHKSPLGILVAGRQPPADADSYNEQLSDASGGRSASKR